MRAAVGSTVVTPDETQRERDYERRKSDLALQFPTPSCVTAPWMSQVNQHGRHQPHVSHQSQVHGEAHPQHRSVPRDQHGDVDMLQPVIDVLKAQRAHLREQCARRW